MAVVDGFSASRQKHALLASLTTRPATPVKDLPAQSRYLVEPLVTMYDATAPQDQRLKTLAVYFGSLRTPARASIAWCINVTKRFLSVAEGRADLVESASLMALLNHALSGSDSRKPFGPSCFAWYVAALSSVVALEQLLDCVVNTESRVEQVTATGFGLANEIFDLLLKQISKRGNDVDREHLAAATLLNDCLGDSNGHFLRNHLWHGFIQPNNTTVPVFQLCVALLEMVVCVFSHRLSTDAGVDSDAKARTVPLVDTLFPQAVLSLLDADAEKQLSFKKAVEKARHASGNTERDAEGETEGAPSAAPKRSFALQPVLDSATAASTIVAWANTVEWIVANGLADNTDLDDVNAHEGGSTPVSRLLVLPLCVVIEVGLRTEVATAIPQPAERERVLLAHFGQQFYTFAQLLVPNVPHWSQLVMDPSHGSAEAENDFVDPAAVERLGPVLRAWSAFVLRQPPLGPCVRNRVAHGKLSLMNLSSDMSQSLCRLAACTIPGCGKLAVKGTMTVLQSTVDAIGDVETVLDVAARSLLAAAHGLLEAAMPSLVAGGGQDADDVVDVVLTNQGLVPRESVKGQVSDWPSPSTSLSILTDGLKAKQSFAIDSVTIDVVATLLDAIKQERVTREVPDNNKDDSTPLENNVPAQSFQWPTVVKTNDVKARVLVIMAAEAALSRYAKEVAALRRLVAERKARTAHRKKLALLEAGRVVTAYVAARWAFELRNVKGDGPRIKPTAMANLSQKLEAVASDSAAPSTIASLLCLGA